MFIAEQQSYIADYEISGDSWDPVIRQFLQGVVFDVKPIVSADRRYITLELRPTTATLLRMPEIVITSWTILDGGANAIMAVLDFPIQFPELQLRKVRTTVTIPDGGIIMLGGMMSDIKFQSETGVPFLSNIPVIGKLFRWNTTDNERRNLSILVTGRILLFDEEENKR
jgi:type II secretory pathway component GspD/PulD (secretin)